MNKHFETLIERYGELISCVGQIEEAFEIMVGSVMNSGKILLAGNGGSCSDCDHIVGELMKSFSICRPIDRNVSDSLLEVDHEMGSVLSQCLEGTIRAINLMNHSSLTSAYSNDRNPKAVVAQQVYGYGDEGDVFWCISTSGNSENIVMGAVTAKAKGLKVVGLTGMKPARIDRFCDVVIKVPAMDTYKVQEYHLPIYHSICLALEERFFRNC